MIWLAIISAAWFTGVLIANLTRDGRRGRQGLPINHNNRSWVRFFWLLPCIYSLAWAIGPRFTWTLLWHLWYCGVKVGLLWMCLFNGLYNTRRHKGWFYPGSEGDEDGFWENVFQRWPWLQYAEHAVCAGMIYLYTKLL